MKTVRQNLSKALLVGLFMFSLIMIALQGSSAAMVAVAAETGNVYAYDNTDVMDDLNGSDGFDIKDYPANANAKGNQAEIYRHGQILFASSS